MSDARLRDLERHAVAPLDRAALFVAEVRAGKRKAVRPVEPFRIPCGPCPECGSEDLGAEVVSWDEETGLPTELTVFCSTDDGDWRDLDTWHQMRQSDWQTIRGEALVWARDHVWVRP